MRIVPIPGWNSSGVLPPINERDPIASEGRSPYNSSLVGLVERFGTSPRRIAILRGFLSYRSQLHAVGLIDGFQWLDGSFCEDVETLRGKDPDDIDVMTFYCLPKREMPEGDVVNAILVANPSLFDHDLVKGNFLVDFYMESLEQPATILVEKVVYWHGLFSHWNIDKMKNVAHRTWKGLVRVDLSPLDDSDAIDLLDQLETQGVQP